MQQVVNRCRRPRRRRRRRSLLLLLPLSTFYPLCMTIQTSYGCTATTNNILYLRSRFLLAAISFHASAGRVSV